MNPQSLIDNHPTAFLVFFPLYFLLLWLLVAAVVSCVGGWFSLAKAYRTRLPFKGTKWSMQSGQMRWLSNYNNVLTLGAGQEGLYLATMPVFRFMHPPLLVPWSHIKVRRSEGWFFKYVILIIGQEAEIPLRVREKVAERLRTAAGTFWPVEET